MAKMDHNYGQAAVELAVFGAILIFILGSILRSAVGNSYSQNQNIKAMRMAMLASWNGSNTNPNQPNVSRNSASVMFIEDRLSPDFNKYGPLDRTPYVANGSGTLSYQLMYPLDASEVSASLPVMDIYINGQHFPLTTAAYKQNVLIPPPQSYTCADPSTLPSGSIQQCSAYQCQRNQREWVSVPLQASQFQGIVPISTAPGAVSSEAQDQNNANTIFSLLQSTGMITSQGAVSSYFIDNGIGSFQTLFDQPAISGDTTGLAAQVAQIQKILKDAQYKYKLFYTLVANPGPDGSSSDSSGEAQFSLLPPTCTSHPCRDKELSADVPLPGATGGTNAQGDMEYDLLRHGSYSTLETQLPLCSALTSCSTGTNTDNITTAACMRCDIAWQWAATAGIPSTNGVYIDASNHNFPSYDINGTLKEQTIYSICQGGGGSCSNCQGSGSCPGPQGTYVSYEDFAGGDMDSTWGTNTCNVRPGLQNNSQIFTFTKGNMCTDGTACTQGASCSDGTTCPKPSYLQILEGKLYNPETGQVVRSVNQRDHVDLVQRTFQLSNDTGRFCDGVHETPPSSIGRCLNSNGCNDINGNVIFSELDYTGPDPNPVEVCIPPGLANGDTCFSNENNIKSTCFDEASKTLYIRSRLEDRRGRFWITDASGQLNVQ